MGKNQQGYRIKESNQLKIFVTAKANARKDFVEELEKNHFMISTTELPIKGRANLAIIGLLANHFNISKTSITISSGYSSKNKVFEIK